MGWWWCWLVGWVRGCGGWAVVGGWMVVGSRGTGGGRSVVVLARWVVRLVGAWSVGGLVGGAWRLSGCVGVCGGAWVGGGTHGRWVGGWLVGGAWWVGR